MLKSLYIQNFVLIDSLDIQFENGFSVITGETGAGKSIILGALGLVLGQRADGKSIQKGCDKCVIEATFDVSKYQLEPFFIENDLEYDSDACILRRELFASGKSRAFVNDSPVGLAILKELGTRLIDIHSQHQNLLLGNMHFQLKVVDVMAENEILLIMYKKEYSRYVELKREQEELEQEQETLAHAEEIKGALYKISQLLDGEETGCVQLLKESLSLAENLDRYYPKAKEIAERIRSAYLDMNDLASETDSQKEDVEFNPERLNWVNERLNLLYTLEQKHHVSTIEDLIAIRDAYQKQLEEINSFDEQIAELNQLISASYQELLQQAAVLSTQRQIASQRISEELVQMVAPLGMPNVRFKVDVLPKEEPDADGLDWIRFMFSANKNGDLQPVEQTASGGEISRLMLCIKAMIAGFTALPAIIFDEVDTGISGKASRKVGLKLKEVSKNRQVICVTHQVQIASLADNHNLIRKNVKGDRTFTDVITLDYNGRIEELARIMGGIEITENTKKLAEEMLNNN